MPGFATFSLPGLDQIRGLALSVGPQAGWLVAAAFSSFGPGDYAADYAFYAWPLPAGSPAPTGRLSVPQILPEMPGWDVAGNEDGELVLVYEVNGGATRAIHRQPLAGSPPEPVVREGPEIEPTFVEEPGGGRTAVLPPEQLAASSPQATPGGFNRPRLVRGSGAEPFTAVSDDGDLHLFESAEPAPTGPVSSGLGEGWVAATPDGFAVVAKRPALGTTQPNTHVPPGELFIHRLDRDFQPVVPPRRLLAEETVYEVAVDVCQEMLVVLATTPRGAVLLTGPAAPSQRPWRRFALHASTGDAAGSPAIACDGGTLHLAFLLAPRTKETRLVTGELPLADPGLTGAGQG